MAFHNIKVSHHDSMVFQNIDSHLPVCLHWLKQQTPNLTLIIMVSHHDSMAFHNIIDSHLPVRLHWLKHQTPTLTLTMIPWHSTISWFTMIPWHSTISTATFQSLCIGKNSQEYPRSREHILQSLSKTDHCCYQPTKTDPSDTIDPMRDHNWKIHLQSTISKKVQSDLILRVHKLRHIQIFSNHEEIPS